MFANGFKVTLGIAAATATLTVPLLGIGALVAYLVTKD
jgi:hypothetical protein